MEGPKKGAPMPTTQCGPCPRPACLTASPGMSSTQVGGTHDTDVMISQRDMSPMSHTRSVSYSINDASSRSRHVHGRGCFPTAQTGSWEKDTNVQTCRRCMRRFTLFLRKHHCRRCGRIFCDACTSHRAYIPENVHITDPALPEMFDSESRSAVRICDWCMNEYHIEPVPPRGRTTATDDTSTWSHLLWRISSPWSGEAPSPIDPDALNECPVCDLHLHTLASTQEREQHVATCLEDGVLPSRAHRMHFLASSLTEVDPDRQRVHYLHGRICGTRSCCTPHLHVLLPCRLHSPVDGQGPCLPLARHGHLRLRVHTQSRAQILDLGACLCEHLRFLSQGVLDPFALARTEFGGLGTHLVAL